MAQHDYNLSNNTGALYRADNNGALQAIVTQNSGATAPAVTFPGMLWLDLSGGGDGVMRRRNQANTAWLTDIGIDQTARNAAAAAQATADAAMPKAGGTFTGAINLPATVPTNNQALSRAQADALYQVRLPTAVAGALLYGTAAGWAATLAPAANDTLLVLSGGLPTWQTGATTAQPNSFVRTKADGTIDATLIPSVASGLRFRGTFRPAVNAEYPTTGGSGSGGAPAVGDFWVIDGLTTGGYTYLTGSLAGVTVYNGDSIAKSDGANWYRMGSSVELEGYLRTDGSIAMSGDLNMGAHSLTNVAGIAARAGTPVPLNNFSIDASNVVISPQRGTTGADLATMTAGQLGTDLGRMQLFVGSGSGNTGLIPVRYFSATAAYAAGEYVVQGGRIWRARAAVTAGAFTQSQWWRVLESEGQENIYGTFRFITRNGIQFGDTVNSPNNPLYSMDHDGTSWAFNTSNPDGTFLKNAFSIIRATGEMQLGLMGVYQQLKINTGAQLNSYGALTFFNEGYDMISLSPGNGQSFVITGRANGQWIFYDGKRAAPAALYNNSQATVEWTFSGNVIGAAGLQANDRDQSGKYYALYGQSGTLRLFMSGVGDVATFASDGLLTVPGNIRSNSTVTGFLGLYTFDRTDYAQSWLQYAQGGYLRWYHNTLGERMSIHTSGDLSIIGTGRGVAWIGSCDRRLKSNEMVITPRAFDGVNVYSYTRDSTGEFEVGPMADEVLEYAQDYYSSFMDADGHPLGGVNIGGLALEIAIYARDAIADLTNRVAALEAASPPQPEPED